MTSGYAGDLPPKEAYDLLRAEPKAQLVDVRTDAEWAFVGLPDLAALGRAPIKLAWQLFPTLQVNPDFVARLSEQVPDKSAPLLFLCRSGARSKAAAMAMTAAGYARAYNIEEGFEGNLDGEKHRGRAGGWKARGLPWVQS